MPASQPSRDLANDYGVYGFAYYHYWFEGRLLLEKPVENLLKWKDINQKYFFFWANHDWIKSVEGKQEILMKQNYGDVKDWDKHYNYFLPYFKDDRYGYIYSIISYGRKNSMVKKGILLIVAWHVLLKMLYQ